MALKMIHRFQVIFFFARSADFIKLLIPSNEQCRCINRSQNLKNSKYVYQIHRTVQYSEGWSIFLHKNRFICEKSVHRYKSYSEIGKLIQSDRYRHQVFNALLMYICIIPEKGEFDVRIQYLNFTAISLKKTFIFFKKKFRKVTLL